MCSVHVYSCEQFMYLPAVQHLVLLNKAFCSYSCSTVVLLYWLWKAAALLAFESKHHAIVRSIRPRNLHIDPSKEAAHS
jgi:hypothetical protein